VSLFSNFEMILMKQIEAKAECAIAEKRESMKKKMKKLLREVDQKAKEREYKRDENGNIIIPMVVQDDSDFLSIFAETETPLISADIAEYLEEKTEDIPADEPLVLRIRSSCIDPVEQDAYRKGVKEYYFTKYMDNRSDLRRNALFAVVLAMTGLLILLFAYLIDAWVRSPYWTEVADTVAAVFIWESVHVAAFGSFELRKRRLRCLALMAMGIEFIPLNAETRAESGTVVH